MVMVFEPKLAEIPAGKPVIDPSPVAPVVVCVILVNAVLIHNVGVEDATLTVLAAVTMMVPVALMAPQPPIRGIV